MPSKANFHVVFDGPAFIGSEMDVRYLAPSLIAISDAIEEANFILNGNKTKVIVNVKSIF